MKIKENKAKENNNGKVDKSKKTGREIVQEKMNSNKSWFEEVDVNDTGNEFDIKMYRDRQEAEDEKIASENDPAEEANSAVVV